MELDRQSTKNMIKENNLFDMMVNGPSNPSIDKIPINPSIELQNRINICYPDTMNEIMHLG